MENYIKKRCLLFTIMVSDKRGVSAIISTVLMIAFVITLFLLISNWIRGSIVDDSLADTEEKLAGQLDCLSATVEITNACAVKTGDTYDKVKLNVDNTGDENVEGLTIRVLNAAGDVATVTYDSSTTAPLGRVLTKSVDNTLSAALSDVAKIEVYPELSSGLCKDQFDSTSNVPDC